MTKDDRNRRMAQALEDALSLRGGEIARKCRESGVPGSLASQIDWQACLLAARYVGERVRNEDHLEYLADVAERLGVIHGCCICYKP